MKKKVAIQQVISDLKDLFQVGRDEEARSVECDGKFLINKGRFERGMVIAMLQDYFKDKVIDNGYLVVNSITLLYTSFEVVEGML